MKQGELDKSIQFVKGVGPRLLKRFQKKGLNTIKDILYFFPRDYQDRSVISRIAEIEPGRKWQCKGRIIASGEVTYPSGKRCYVVHVADETGKLSVKWLNYNIRKWKLIYSKGKNILIYGNPSIFRGQLEFLHPDVTILDDKEEESKDPQRGVVPVYSDIEGIHQNILRKIIAQSVSSHISHIEDPLPEELRVKKEFPTLQESLWNLHFPPEEIDFPSIESHIKRYVERIIFDEFFSMQLGLARRKHLDGTQLTFSIPWDKKIVDEVKSRLPFTLTDDQRKSVNEILKDLRKDSPMHRLLQGDVGSGKTILAWIASMIVWNRGFQIGIMAPTEILAGQHYLTFNDLSRGLPINIRLLTSSTDPGEKGRIKEGVAKGDIHILVGTHALLQEDVSFDKLALVIVDEQHRFGVYQRLKLREKGVSPHLLVMTATPIPRSLAMALYGDLDISLIKEMPPGRIPVITEIVAAKEKKRCYEEVRKEIKSGGQAYIVFPLIEESEKLDIKGAKEMSAELNKGVFNEYRVELLHGRMKGGEKEKIIREFRSGRIQILVSTTVIEVGIDVPNATVMAIENAERFGLAQLHQLRGRIGRGTRQSYCYLISGRGVSKEAWERLKVMSSTTDGFKVAEMDLEIRGPGDYLGTRQSGMPDLIFGNLIRDSHILKDARDTAFSLIEEDPDLEKEAHRELRTFIMERWGDRIDFAFT